MFSNSSLLTFYCRQNAKIRKSLIILYLFFKAVYPLSRYFEVIMLFLGAQYIKKHVVAPPYIHSAHPQTWILGHRAAPPQEMEDYIFSRASGQKLLMERMVFLSSFIKVFMALNLNLGNSEVTSLHFSSLPLFPNASALTFQYVWTVVVQRDLYDLFHASVIIVLFPSHCIKQHEAENGIQFVKLLCDNNWVTTF